MPLETIWSDDFDDLTAGAVAPGWSGSTWVETSADRGGNVLTINVTDSADAVTASPPLIRVRPGQSLRASGVARRIGEPSSLSAAYAWFRADGTFIKQDNAISAAMEHPIGTWAALPGVLVPVPPDATHVEFKLVIIPWAAPGGHFGSFDDLTLEAFTAEAITGLGTENLLVNGGFRDGLTGWTAAGFQVWDETWHSVDPIADGDTNNEALTSSFLGYVNDTAGAPTQWPSVQQDVPVQEGHTYTVRMMAYVNQPAGGASVQIKLLDANKQQVREVRVNVQQPGVWAPVSATFTAQPGEAFANVVLFCTVPAETRAWIDQAGMYEGTTVPDWENTGPVEKGRKTYPDVKINGHQYAHMTRSASWQLGRSWWFAGPEPGVATIELYGDRIEIEPGDPLVISGVAALFTGVVDDVVVTAGIDQGRIVRITRITATCYMGWLVRGSVKGWVTTGTSDVSSRFASIAAKAKVKINGFVPSYAPAATYPPFLPALNLPSTERIRLIDVLDDQERLANSIVQVMPDNKWRIQYRIALGSTALTRPPVPLDGDNCPYEAEIDRQSVDKVINIWQFEDADEEYTGQLPDGTNSIAKYGPSGYDIPWTKALAAVRYQNSMRFAVAQAMTSWNVSVRVLRRSLAVNGIGPFDYVSWRDRMYQALQMTHVVTPGSWTVRLHLDATQSVISGGSTGDETTPPDPVPPDQPPPTPPPPTDPPPVTRKRATITVTADKDGYTALSTGGLNAGNGAGGLFLVGRLADGVLTRGFVGFPTQTFLGRNRTVVSATLTLKTNRGGCMSWGSSPKIKVQRVTGSWSEGTYNAASGCGFATANALKHPGPSVTSTGEVVKSHNDADNLTVTVSIPTIAQAWLDGAAQRGVRLVGYSETSSSNRSAFDASGSGRAKLTITYEYDE